MLQRQWISMVLALGVMLFEGCGEEPSHKAAKGTGLKVSVDTTETTEQAIIHEAVGTVKANTASTIASKLMGTVTSISVKEGDRFKKGDLLMVIDPRQVSAQLRQAEAALEEAQQARTAALSARDQAESSAQLARITYERYEQLMEEASASQQEFDEIKAKYQQAEAALAQAKAMVSATEFKVKQAKAAVATVRVSRQDAAIRAPYDGYVTGKLIDEGDLAAPGKPLLDIEAMEGYRIDTEIPEKYIHAIALDQKVRITLTALDSRFIEGTIAAISPAADRKSHSFLAKVSLPEHDGIKAGMFARVSIPIESVEKRLIPVTAVVREGQLTGIFLVDEDQISRFRLIRTGRTFDQSIEVLSGLRNGDRYVVNPPLDLKNGMKLEVAQ